MILFPNHEGMNHLNEEGVYDYHEYVFEGVPEINESVFECCECVLEREPCPTMPSKAFFSIVLYCSPIVP